MPTELFRCAFVRQPQLSPSAQNPAGNLLFQLEETELAKRLRALNAAGSRTEMLKIAETIMQSPGFATVEDQRVINFQKLTEQAPSENYNDTIRSGFSAIFDKPANQFIQDPAYTDMLRKLSDSMVVAAILTSVSPKTRQQLVTLSRTFFIIGQLATEKPVHKNSFQTYKIILPAGIFPLPNEDAAFTEEQKKKQQQARELLEENRKRKQKQIADLDAYKKAADELTKLFDNSAFNSENEDMDDNRRAVARLARGGFQLAERELSRISDATRSVLKEIGIDDNGSDIARAVQALETAGLQISQRMFAEASPAPKVARIGNNLVPVRDLNELSVLDASQEVAKTPGQCPPDVISPQSADNKPLITSGNHEVRVLGIADLLIVEQELERYQLGEIAHIENVLKSETRDRKHRLTETVEETVTTENEETETKEKDLTSAERFELQTESQKVISESSSMQAGITVNASYGFVDTSANANYATTDSMTDSQSSASNFARDTTSRAVSKLTKRTLEKRVQRTLRETEEINQHTFNNKDGDNISGIYRFVDKIYSAQIVNYGKRLMLEFIVPEPAAFLRFAMGRQPVEDLLVEKPEVPGFCMSNGKVFVPLRAQDIDRSNYMMWASKYSVENISPPPPQTLVISTAITSTFKELENAAPGDSKEFTNTKNISVDIEDGYRPVNADIVIDAQLEYRDQPTDQAFLHVLIDKRNIVSNGLSAVTFTPGVWKNVAIAANSFNKVSYAAVINIFCRLTEEREQRWKMETFNAIMNAYQDQKSKYDNAIAVAKIQSGFGQPSATNPFLNRETEKIELKKSCIALLTGQRFDSFDAMKSSAGQYGYPEIDFEESGREGLFISFFEQGIEWNNMTYIFYPYFWANKEQWLTLSQITDQDPLFAKFLQAGAARVNLPVRPGFETSIMKYLSSNIIWPGNDEIVNSDEEQPDQLHISIIDELKSQSNNMNKDGKGYLSVTNGSTAITGEDTEFSSADENKRIVIRGKIYLIKKVDSGVSIILDQPYKGETGDRIGYAFGAKLIGEPWEILVPTSLVKLDNYEIAW